MSNNNKRRPQPKRMVQDDSNESVERAARSSEANRPQMRSSGTIPTTRPSRGAATKPSRSKFTMEEEEERPIKPPARNNSLTLQREEQDRYAKIQSKNSANAQSIQQQRVMSTNRQAMQKQYSNSRPNYDEISTRGNSIQSVGSSDNDSIVNLVRDAYAKTERTERQSPPARNVASTQRRVHVPQQETKSGKEKVVGNHLAELVTGSNGVPSYHLRRPDAFSTSGTSTVVPPPPALRQQTNFSQPGAFRMSLGGLQRPAGADSLVSTTMTQRTLMTQQQILEASLVRDRLSVVRDRLPDDECPSPPPNLNFNTSSGTHMTAATTATASRMSVVEAQRMDESHTLRAFFKNRKVKCVICMLFSFFVVLVVGAVYGITGFGLNQSNVSSESSEPTLVPSSPGDLDLDYFVLVALPEHSRESLRKENSSQSKALAWLKNNTVLETYSLQRRLQRFSLATIFYATGGERRWENKDGWLSDEDECSWYTGQETNVSICSEGIYEYLSLGKNQLRGTFPDEIGLLSSLQMIDLSQNILTGYIPSTLGELTAVREIFLNDNYLSGRIPEEIGSLSLLEEFDVEFNFVAQVLPQTLAQLKNLRGLILDRNLLVGSLSTQMGQLTNLEVLYLYSNAFSGTIPTDVGSLSSLTQFWIDDNFFSGTLPSEIGLLKNVRELTLGNNTLSGPIPIELFQSCKELRVLDIFQNSFTGTLPTEVGLLSNAQALYFDRNLLKGNLPSELGLLNNVAALWLHANNFRGTIPLEIGRLTKLSDLDLSQNGLTGDLPTTIGLLQDAEILSFASNALTGPIPSELGKLSRLGLLALENNMFTGTMPYEICQLVETGQLAPQNLTVDCSLVQCSCCEECAISAIQDND